MKKIIATSLIVMFPFVLTACVAVGKKVQNPEDNAPQAQETKTEATEPTKDENVFTSIRDAITKEIGLKCFYTDEDNQTVETYIKGSKVYLTGESKVDEKTVVFTGIMKDKKYYLWSSESNEGVIIPLDKQNDEDESLTMGDTQINSEEDVIRKLEENKNNCKQHPVSETLFDLPSNITFKEFDLSNMWGN